MRATLPPPESETVTLPLVGRDFVFRRLTWVDEIRFTQDHPTATRRDYVAAALISVGGKSCTYDVARQILNALPKPIADRVMLFYLGSLPGRRILTTDFPYHAPEAAAYQSRVSAEEESLADTEDEILERRFGSEDVQASKELAERMVQGTHYAGVTPALEPPTPDIDEEPPSYHMVVEP